MILQCVCSNIFESDIYDNCPVCGLIPIRIDKPNRKQARERERYEKKVRREQSSNYLEYQY